MVTSILPPGANGPISLPAADSVVTSTPFLDWQPGPAIGGVAQVTLTQSEAVCAFGIRNKLARTPADVAAFAPINPVTLKLSAAFWGRALTAIRDGGQGIVAFNPHREDRKRPWAMGAHSGCYASVQPRARTYLPTYLPTCLPTSGTPW